jgi:hypothetical protein
LSLSRIEFRAAIRLRSKLGDIDQKSVDELISEFNGHLTGVFQLQPINEPVMDAASGAVDQHYLRAYDAMQLGGYIVFRASIGDEVESAFVCADDRLLRAARAEGFSTIDPATNEQV